MTANNSTTAFKILVDADSCPVKDIILQVAEETDASVLMFANLSHQLNFTGNKVRVLTVDNIPQAVDLAILNHLTAGDLVVTGDYGLASLVLSRAAVALSPRGFVFTGKNIDRLLMQRHIEAKIRRSGGRTKGPRALTDKDRQRFAEVLRRLIAARSGNESGDPEKGSDRPAGLP